MENNIAISVLEATAWIEESKIEAVAITGDTFVVTEEWGGYVEGRTVMTAKGRDTAPQDALLAYLCHTRVVPGEVVRWLQDANTKRRSFDARDDDGNTFKIPAPMIAR